MLKQIRFFFLLLQLVILNSYAIDALPSGIDKELTKGWQLYLENGDTVTAEKHFAASFKSDPSNMFAASSYAQILHQQAKKFQAVEVLLQAFKSAKWDRWCEPALADLLNLKAYCKSLNDITAVLKGRLDNPEISWVEAALLSSAVSELSSLEKDFTTYSKINDSKNFVNEYLVLGPFSNRTGQGFAENIFSDKDLSKIDFTASWQGRGRKIEWFKAQVPADGLIDLGKILYPGNESLAYVCVFVEVDEDLAATLALEQGGASRLEVNNEVIYEDPKYVEGSYSLQRLIDIKLKKGINRILIKLAGNEKIAPDLRMRVLPLTVGELEKAGSAKKVAELDGKIKYRIDKEAQASYVPHEVEAVSEVRTWDESFGNTGLQWGALKAFQDELRQNQKSVFSRVNLSYLTSYYGLKDQDNLRTRRYDADLVKDYPNCPMLLIASAYSQLNENNRRELLEKVIVISPAENSARVALLIMKAASGYYAEVGIEVEELLKRRDISPAFTASLLRLKGDIALVRNWMPEAFSAYTKEREIFPYADLYNSPRAENNFLVTTYSVDEKYIIALSAYKKVYDYSTVTNYASSLLGKNNLEEAEKVYSEYAVRNVYDDAWLGASKCAEARGDFDRAIGYLSRAQLWMPQSPVLLEKIARLTLRKGDKDKALELFNASLRLKKDNPELEQYVKYLTPKKEAFYAAYEIDLDSIKGQDATSFLYPDFDSLLILDQSHVEVNKNGTSRRMIRSVEKALRPQAVRMLSHKEIYYDSERQQVEVVKATVIQPDGTVINNPEITESSYSSGGNSGGAMYGSGQIVRVSIPHVKPDSIVDFQYTISDTSEKLYHNEFSDIFYFGGINPTLRMSYTAVFPETDKINFAVFKSQQQPAIETKGGKRTYKWDVSNLPGIKAEPMMPPFDEIKPALGLTTFKDFKKMGKWVWDLFKPQTELPEDIKIFTAELIKDAKTREEKILAIYNYIIHEIRYVSISFGKFGYTPHTVERTFRSRYGDCKDTAILFAAMLKEAGITAYAALVRTNNLGADSLKLPRLGIYNHCIAYIPPEKDGGKHYWLDGTTDYFPLGVIPYMDQGTEALVITPEGGEVVLIDPPLPEQQMTEVKVRVVLDKNGNAKATMREHYSGEVAAQIKRMLERPQAFKQMLENYINSLYSGATISEFKHIDVDEIANEAWLEMTIDGSGLVTKNNGESKIRSVLIPQNYSGLAVLESREYPLMLGMPRASKLKTEIVLSEGQKVLSLPEDIELETPVASFSRKVIHSKNVVTIDIMFVMKKQQVPVADYVEFKKLTNSVTKAFAEWIVFSD